MTGAGVVPTGTGSSMYGTSDEPPSAIDNPIQNGAGFIQDLYGVSATVAIDLPSGPLPEIVGTPNSGIGYWGSSNGLVNGYYQSASATIRSSPNLSSVNRGFARLTDSFMSGFGNPQFTPGSATGTSIGEFGGGAGGVGFGGMGGGRGTGGTTKVGVSLGGTGIGGRGNGGFDSGDIGTDDLGDGNPATEPSDKGGPGAPATGKGASGAPAKASGAPGTPAKDSGAPAAQAKDSGAPAAPAKDIGAPAVPVKDSGARRRPQPTAAAVPQPRPRAVAAPTVDPRAVAARAAEPLPAQDPEVLDCTTTAVKCENMIPSPSATGWGFLFFACR